MTAGRETGPDLENAHSGSRLERALQVFVQWRTGSEHTDRELLLDAHPELRDLLEPMFDPVEEEPTNQDPLSARRFGDYRLVREIGRGGMGVVYEAVQLTLDRTVAVKVLPAHLTLQASAIARFLREAALAGQLDHEGIVQVHDVGSTGGHHWFAMDFVEGAPLDAVLRELGRDAEPATSGHAVHHAVERHLHRSSRADRSRTGTSPMAEVFDDTFARTMSRLTLQVAEALTHAHHAGIVHRDVKPSNLLVRLDGRIILTDFGLARGLTQPGLTATGDAPGTPHYTAPEQAAGDVVDGRADVFALGATFYEMLTLRRAFEGKTTAEVLSKVRDHEPRNPRGLSRNLPEDLGAILQRAMEKDPAHRYPGSEAFGADLRAFLAGHPVAARPLSRSQRLLRWARRNPAVAVLLAMLFSTFATATIVLSLQTAMLSTTVEDLRRLSDLKRVRDLFAQVDRLPAHRVDHQAGLAAWLLEAEELMGRRVRHAERLSELRAMALPWSTEDRLRDQQPPVYVLETRRAAQNQLAKAAGVPVEEPTRWTYRLADPAAQWEHDTLAELLVRIEEFSEAEHGPLDVVRRRLSHVRGLESLMQESAPAQQRAIETIADPQAAPDYQGLHIGPQLGLLPLGLDRESGLYEFWMPFSGAEPKRDDRGRIRPDGDMALVFVLLPGGRVRIGADPLPAGGDLDTPYVDPQVGENEQPSHEVELDPFFLSKYELTAGQWLRLVGDEPSQNTRPDRTGHPIEDRHVYPLDTISPERAELLLEVLGLGLPTEAQWEYAFRAGTTTVWPCGNHPRSLAGQGNLSDRSLMVRLGVPESSAPDAFERDDGHAYSAPVGQFPPNGFGLFDMIGNVQELTSCHPIHYSVGPAPGTGARRRTEGRHTQFRIARGSAYIHGSRESRSAFRGQTGIHTAIAERGIRPALRLDR